MNIDVFFKVENYACLYKAYGEIVDAISAKDITITLIREAKPMFSRTVDGNPLIDRA